MAEDARKELQIGQNPRIERDRELIVTAREKGRGPLLGAFVRLSGPGWLQSAITLGGGSLSSSMYLGVLGGFAFLWLQPVAMIAGIIMLSAIAYVTLSTNRRPFRAINEHVNPVLGWGWLLASMLANLVWSMPQFALATASFQQNLFPGIFGPDVMPDPWGKMVVLAIVLTIGLTAAMLYTVGGVGMKIFEIVVKCLVGTTVLCFIGVVIKLTTSGEVNWGAIGSGFVPNLKMLSTPNADLMPHIEQVADKFQGFWTSLIVGKQRDVMISAAATAVGINMTFLLPYSMLRKGWDRDFRGLAIFDLSTGLFFPFIIATSCVVIAAASQFHGVPAAGLIGEERDPATNEVIVANPKLLKDFNGLLGQRLALELGAEAVGKLTAEEKTAQIQALPEADRRMAAILATRDAFDLAGALKPLTGDTFARYVFGLGVLGMAMGAMTMLMLINGLCFCELLNVPPRGWPQRIGCFMVSIGTLGPFFWSNAQMWIAIPTSVFAMTLLPFAYFSFFFLMNQKKLLGDDLPKGLKRVWWNVLMAGAAGLAACASVYSIYSKTGKKGIVALVIFLCIVIAVQIKRSTNRKPAA